MCKAGDVLSIINDRADIAVAAGADGVHLGQNDLPIEQARKLQLAPLIIGKSTHSLEQLRSACDEYPSYVSLGPVFATKIKPTAEPVGLDYVRQGTEKLADTGICQLSVYVVGKISISTGLLTTRTAGPLFLPMGFAINATRTVCLPASSFRGL